MAGVLQMRGLRAKFTPAVTFLKMMLWPWIQARLSLADLHLGSGHASPLSRGGIIAVAVHYGNHAFATTFLEHHRRLGVSEFVFLDLSSDGGLTRHLGEQTDCAIWRPAQNDTPGPVTLWLNALRHRYAVGRWCLSLDTCDAFVFYRCETRGLSDFTDFLDTESRDHAFGLLVEMYGDKPAAELASEASPGHATLNYFDPFGMVTLDPGRRRDVIVRGGLQRRTLFKTTPRRSPALNQIPLVKWRSFYGYLTGTRVMVPFHLNNPHARWHSSPTVCILRFALLSDRETLERAARWETEVLLRDGGVASYAGLAKLLDAPLKQSISRAYTGSGDLVDCGLLNPGQWF